MSMVLVQPGRLREAVHPGLSLLDYSQELEVY